MTECDQGQGEVVALVKASQAGDKEAFNSLVCLHQQQAMRLAVSILGDVHDAAEVVQQAFVKAYLGLAGLKRPEGFRAWLLRIVANEAISRQRSRRRRDRLPLPALWQATDRIERSPDEKEHGKEMQAAIQRAMAKLTRNEAQAISLFALDDLPHQEVARIMGCSPESVRWHVYRARQKLRVLLKEYLE
jgi:RNA polymerase sigma-70 factor (ECF subfamily)